MLNEFKKDISGDETANHELLNNQMTIEVIYALPNEQSIFTITANKNITVMQAIEQSKILDQYPEIDLDKNKIGICSKACKLSDRLHDWDRIEIYRPLIADPKEARKKRANKPK